MVLISSSGYQEAKASLRAAMQICGCVEGGGREDDERLTKLDELLSAIDRALHPATDER